MYGVIQFFLTQEMALATRTPEIQILCKPKQDKGVKLLT